MALDNIHLRKLLKIMFLEPNERRSAIRADIREEIARDIGPAGAGEIFTLHFGQTRKIMFLVSLISMTWSRSG